MTEFIYKKTLPNTLTIINIEMITISEVMPIIFIKCKESEILVSPIIQEDNVLTGYLSQLKEYNNDKIFINTNIEAKKIKLFCCDGYKYFYVDCL